MPPLSSRPLETLIQANSGAYLVSAFSSLVFLPSREARCCSKASRRLLGAWNRQDTADESLVHIFRRSFFKVERSPPNTHTRACRVSWTHRKVTGSRIAMATCRRLAYSVESENKGGG